MRLYLIGLDMWAGTQADAKALAREHGLAWREVDVPTDKAGLMAFLNAGWIRPAAEAAADPEPIDRPAAQPVPVPVPGLPQAKIDHPLNLMAIEDFIEGAQPHQLGIIMRGAAQRLQIIGQDLDKRQREAEDTAES